MFIDGFLALASAFPTPSTVTEYAAQNYARQAISFCHPQVGIARNSTAFSFGFGVSSTITGFAIFSTPTGPECLLVLPFISPQAFGSQPVSGEAGSYCLLFSDMVRDPTGAALSLDYNAGAILGSCWRDPQDYIGMSPALSSAGTTIPGGPQRAFSMGTMIAGTPLAIKRGTLSAQEAS